MRIYNVNAIPLHQLKITGRGEDPLWEKGEALTDFSAPWEALKDTQTAFKALWDGEYFFFCYKVRDDSVHIDTTDESFNSINVSDRVELFFRSNAALDPYYCLEIDPTPRIMDFRAYPNRNFDFAWRWPSEDLIVKSSLSTTGFCVEGKISITSLKQLNLIHNNTIETGLFRAKFIKKEAVYEPIWITWVNPKTETPDFHLASSFGILKLM